MHNIKTIRYKTVYLSSVADLGFVERLGASEREVVIRQVEDDLKSDLCRKMFMLAAGHRVDADRSCSGRGQAAARASVTLSKRVRRLNALGHITPWIVAMMLPEDFFLKYFCYYETVEISGTVDVDVEYTYPTTTWFIDPSAVDRDITLCRFVDVYQPDVSLRAVVGNANVSVASPGSHEVDAEARSRPLFQYHESMLHEAMAEVRRYPATARQVGFTPD